jgi:hypothetical protein
MEDLPILVYGYLLEEPELSEHLLQAMSVFRVPTC